MTTTVPKKFLSSSYVSGVLSKCVFSKDAKVNKLVRQKLRAYDYRSVATLKSTILENCTPEFKKYNVKKLREGEE